MGVLNWAKIKKLFVNTEKYVDNGNSPMIKIPHSHEEEFSPKRSLRQLQASGDRKTSFARLLQSLNKRPICKAVCQNAAKINCLKERPSIKILVWRSLPLVAVALALPLFSQSAKATPIDFTCSTSAPTLTNPPCTGTVTLSGGVATGSGINVQNDLGPTPPPPDTPDQGNLFTLAFTSSVGGNVTLTEISGDGSTLTGTVTGSSVLSGPVQTDVSLIVDFATLPSDFATFLGTPAGSGAATTIDVTTSGVVTNAGVNIMGATPEPASMLLYGTGIFLIGGILRRRLV
jgi:hypothetical protein